MTSLTSKLSDSQRCMLRAIDDFARPGEEGWAEVELQWSVQRGIPDYLVSSAAVATAKSLHRKGLLGPPSEGPSLTPDGVALLERGGRAFWRSDGSAAGP